MPDLFKRTISEIHKGCKSRCEKKWKFLGGGGLPKTLWNGNSRGVGDFKLKNHPWEVTGEWIFSGTITVVGIIIMCH